MTDARPGPGRPATGIVEVPVVELTDVVRVYPGHPPLQVLHGVSLRVFGGERVAIVGASGSGKTTMLSIMGVLDEPTSGTVAIDGEDTSRLPEWRRAALRSQRIGFVFQQFFLLPAITALENVATGLLYSGIGRRERLERAEAALDRVGLGMRLEHRPGELSGGEQQRVAIARALVREPGVLFADEPTGALDSATGEAIISLLAGVPRTTAVVVITHDAHVAARMSRQIHLQDGRIVAPAPADIGRTPA